jgi:competence protein ComFC
MDRPALLAYNTFWQVIDWVFPPQCVGCGKLGEVLCADCFNSIHFLRTGLCQRCGYPRGKKLECNGCGEIHPHFIEQRSLAVYNGVIEKSVIRLKYKNDLAMGLAYSRSLANLVETSGWQVDVVVPVPLSKERLKSRGYNQAAVLAFPLALELQLPMDDKSIIKIKDTGTQVKLGARERQANLAGAYEPLGNHLRNRSVLVVDDVITTGSTINECALAILNAGAKEVYGLSLGRSVLSNDAT